MISRKKILRSQSEEKNSPNNYGLYEVEEVWYNKDKLYQDHISEILRKWDQIDDEIWGKVICMERNRRIAKAYSRVPVLTISGSKDGFDGYKIGLNGFENSARDSLTKTVKTHIGKGVRMKMDDMGNIIIKRMSNCDVFIRGWDKESNSVSKEIVDLGGELEFEKSVKLFDMKKFQSSIARELRSAYPDRRKLENQCICAIAFVKDATDVLDLCSWVLLINIVALDLLKSRFPPMAYSRVDDMLTMPAPKFVSIYEQQKLSRSSSDEDTYPTSSSTSSPSSRPNPHASSQKVSKASADQKPPELPRRDFPKRVTRSKSRPELPTPDYDEEENAMRFNSKSQTMARRRLDDPYYCGMRAKVSGKELQALGKSHAGNSATLIMQQHNAGGASRKMTTLPAPKHQKMRKCQSTSYLNSYMKTPLYADRNSFYPGQHNPYSIASSDPYTSIKTNSQDDIYAPLYGYLGGTRKDDMSPGLAYAHNWG